MRREPYLPRTTALLEEAVAHRVFPGCAFGVLRRDGLPFDSAGAVGRFTYEAEAPPVLPGTVYDLASLTKVLATTLACMRLFERGLLELDRPLAAWLPGFTAAAPSDSRRGAVTARMLLDHSSGLPGYGRLFEQAADREAMIELALRQPLTADPGTRAEYSDIGFILLGHLLETLLGEGLDRYCRREIHGPLGMTETCFCPAPELRPQIPPTEEDRELRRRVIQGEVQDENAWRMDGVAGHAGLFASVADVLAAAECLLAGGTSRSGARLLESGTIELFAARSLQPPGSSRALGWDTPSPASSAGNAFSARSIGHLGYAGTSLWIDLEARVAAVLLTNRTWPDRASGAIRALRPRFHDTLRAELAEIR